MFGCVICIVLPAILQFVIASDDTGSPLSVCSELERSRFNYSSHSLTNDFDAAKMLWLSLERTIPGTLPYTSANVTHESRRECSITFSDVFRSARQMHWYP